MAEGWDPVTRTWSGEPGAVPLPPRLRGTLRSGDADLARAADDFGHLVHRRPRGVCVPTDPEQVVELLAWAHQRRLPVAARGAGHSLWGQAQAAGGVGGTTHRFGLQVDQVVALQVATPRGGLRWCDAEHDAEVFDAVRAGHGLVGVVTAADLALVPAPRWVRRREREFADPAAFLDAAREAVLGGRFDYVEGQVQVGDDDGARVHVLETVTHGESGDGELLAHLDFADRPDALEAAHRGNRAFLDRVRRVGGHLYPVNAATMTPDAWRAHLGDRWELLAAAKRTHDPHGILAPGQGFGEQFRGL